MLCYCVSYFGSWVSWLCVSQFYLCFSSLWVSPLCQDVFVTLVLLWFRFLDSHVTVWYLPSLFCLPVSACHLDPKSLYNVVPADIMSKGVFFLAQLSRFTELLKKTSVPFWTHQQLWFILGKKWKMKTMKGAFLCDCSKGSWEMTVIVPQQGREEVIEVLDQ